MLKKSYELIEGSFALLALVSIIGVSTFTVLSLNPKLYDPNNQKNVAGIQVEATEQDQYAKLPLVFSDLNHSDKYSTNLFVLPNTQRSFEYVSNLKPNQAGNYKYDFIQIKNPNDTDASFKITTSVIGQIQDQVKINLIDSLDFIQLFDDSKDFYARVITVPARTSRIFKVEYQYLANINFSFSVKFLLEN
jgi:hypothetical protein